MTASKKIHCVFFLVGKERGTTINLSFFYNLSLCYNIFEAALRVFWKVRAFFRKQSTAFKLNISSPSFPDNAKWDLRTQGRSQKWTKHTQRSLWVEGESNIFQANTTAQVEPRSPTHITLFVDATSQKHAYTLARSQTSRKFPATKKLLPNSSTKNSWWLDA